nr:MAG TPA: hypothetical protein [Caudoviricetes sp.]
MKSPAFSGIPAVRGNLPPYGGYSEIPAFASSRSVR